MYLGNSARVLRHDRIAVKPSSFPVFGYLRPFHQTQGGNNVDRNAVNHYCNCWRSQLRIFDPYSIKAKISGPPLAGIGVKLASSQRAMVVLIRLNKKPTNVLGRAKRRATKTRPKAVGCGIFRPLFLELR